MGQLRQMVLILTDTQRRDMVGIYGDNGIRTPALDRLARDGVVFERAYCTQPVCAPSRSAMFTGLFPHSNGCWSNNMALGADVKTVAQRLEPTGVRCGFIGKWHLDRSDYFGMGRCPEGWDPECWYDMRDYLQELSPEDRMRSRQVDTITSGEGISEEFTYAHRCSDRAVQFLRKHRNSEFFLVVSYDEPHHPYLAPRRFSEEYAEWTMPDYPNLNDSLEGKPDHVRIWAESEKRPGSRRGLALYLGCNTFVDEEIGRVLTAIDQEIPGALVLYTSDHGDALGAHQIWGKGPAMYEEITGVPLMARWPEHIPAGARCAAAVSQIDLTPTILDVFGLENYANCQGKSLLTALSNPSELSENTAFMEFERYEVDHDGFGAFQPIRAASDGRLKLVINLLATDELYDLEQDPYEMTNLIGEGDYALRRNALHARLLDWMNQTRDPFRGYYWEHRAWRTDVGRPTWSYTNMTRQRENDPDEPRQLDYATGLEMTTAVRKKE